MLTTRAQKMLMEGIVVEYDTIGTLGTCYIVKHGGKFYSIIDDGTNNGFYNAGHPVLFKIREARELLVRRRVPDIILKERFGWEITDYEKQELGVFPYEISFTRT